MTDASSLFQKSLSEAAQVPEPQSPVDILSEAQRLMGIMRDQRDEARREFAEAKPLLDIIQLHGEIAQLTHVSAQKTSELFETKRLLEAEQRARENLWMRFGALCDKQAKLLNLLLAISRSKLAMWFLPKMVNRWIWEALKEWQGVSQPAQPQHPVEQ